LGVESVEAGFLELKRLSVSYLPAESNLRLGDVILGNSGKDNTGENRIRIAKTPLISSISYLNLGAKPILASVAMGLLAGPEHIFVHSLLSEPLHTKTFA